MVHTSVRVVRTVSLTLERVTHAATVGSRPACVSACPEKVNETVSLISGALARL